MDTKLNVGVSLHNSTEGFLNIGLDFDTEFGKIIQKGNLRILRHDVTKKIPLPDNTVEFIYASHIVEHLSIEDFYFFINDCYRLLKTDGILRIVCPDLKKWVLAYINRDEDFFKNYYEILKSNYKKPWSKVDYHFVNLPADFFMSSFYNWNHKWGFDMESILLHLKLCGFTQVLNTEYRKSLFFDIEKIEPEFHKIESLYIEVKKT